MRVSDRPDGPINGRKRDAASVSRRAMQAFLAVHMERNLVVRLGNDLHRRNLVRHRLPRRGEWGGLKSSLIVAGDERTGKKRLATRAVGSSERLGFCSHESYSHRRLSLKELPMATPPNYREVHDPEAASSLNVLAGIWLILSPFIFQYWGLPAPTWNSIVIGVAVTLIAALRVAEPLRNAGLSWINFLLGVWMIVSPWVLGYSSQVRLVWNAVVVGILVGALAMWSALTVSPRAMRRRA